MQDELIGAVEGHILPIFEKYGVAVPDWYVARGEGGPLDGHMAVHVETGVEDDGTAGFFRVMRLPSRDTHGCYTCGSMPVTFGELSAGFLVWDGERADPLASCGFHLETTMVMWETLWREKEEE